MGFLVETEGGLMPLRNASLTSADKLYDLIEKVVIVEGVIPSDPVIWEIHLNEKILRVDAEKIYTPRAFEVQYLKAFHIPAPLISAKNWRELIESLGMEKAEHVKSKEESGNVFIAKQVFELICERENTDDPDEAISQELLFKYTKDEQTFFAMPSYIIKKNVDSCGYKIPFENLSSTMSDLGLKKEGTHNVRYNGPQKRSWLFIPDAVLEVRGR